MENEIEKAMSDALTHKSIRMTIVYEVPLEFANVRELLDELRSYGSAEVTEFTMIEK